MKRQPFFNDVISLLGMVISLLIIHGFDRWVRQLKLAAGSSFNFAPYLSVMTVTKLAAAIMLMALVWWVLIHSRSSWVSGVVYFLAGISILFLPFLVFVLHVSLPFGLVTLFPDSLLLDASAFLAVIGLALMIKIGGNRSNANGENTAVLQ